MSLNIKIACFLLAFIFIVFPVFSQSAEGEEPQESEESPLEESPFFIEELFIFYDAFSFGESYTDEENSAEEALPEVSQEEKKIAADKSGENLTEDEILAALKKHEDEEGGEIEIAAVVDEEDYDDDYLDEFFDEDAFFFEAPDFVMEVPTYEMRSIDDIFPNLSQGRRTVAMTAKGYRNSFLREEAPSIVPDPDYGIDLLGSVLRRNPSHLIEALVVVPYNDRELDLLDVYNALGRIEKIKDAAVVINGRNYHAFTESSRLESAGKRRDIPDPMPVKLLPMSETIYLRIKEVNFGNLFIRGVISLSMYGITYNMTNFISVRYFLVPLVKEERFSAVIYVEPVKEGILIYCMSGFYIPGFIADKVNLTPNINRRIEIFTNWITEGLKNLEREEQN